MNRRRVIQLVLLLLVGGAIVNVAMAWGAALSVHLERGVVVPGGDDFYVTAPCNCLHWDFWFVRGPGFQRTTAASAIFSPVRLSAELVRPDLVPRWSRMQQKPGSEGILLAEDACGWPLYSCSCTYGLERNPLDFVATSLQWGLAIEGVHRTGLPASAQTAALPIRHEYIYARALPLRPIWPGFAINTIFYAAILWVVWFGPGKLKRTLRSRRGQCPACAYPWGAGTSPVCTECGGPVGKRPNVKTSKHPNEELTPNA